jgi:integrase
MSLTEKRVAEFACPPGKAEAWLWDVAVRGFGVRAYPDGRKVYVAQYRTGGRGSRQRRERLGSVGQVTLEAARRAARRLMGEVANGQDPVAERRGAARREETRLDRLLEAYDQRLERRRAVKRKEAVSLLRRELVAKLGAATDVAELSRRVLVKRVEAVAADRPGTAAELRKHAGGLLNFAVDQGLLAANPLAGMRRERRTRAERLERPGRAMDDRELGALWRAAGTYPDRVFGAYLRLLLLLGVRRTELATVRWPDLDLKRRVWTLKDEATKTGEGREVPLPGPALDLIRTAPRFAGTALMLPGRSLRPMSGWTQRVADFLEHARTDGVARFTLHDLRRTYRSGLTRIGVPEPLAELMVGHRRRDLIEAYDRERRFEEQQAAAERWAAHVLACAEGVERWKRLAS